MGNRVGKVPPQSAVIRVPLGFQPYFIHRDGRVLLCPPKHPQSWRDLSKVMHYVTSLSYMLLIWLLYGLREFHWIRKVQCFLLLEMPWVLWQRFGTLSLGPPNSLGLLLPGLSGREPVGSRNIDCLVSGGLGWETLLDGINTFNTNSACVFISLLKGVSLHSCRESSCSLPTGKSSDEWFPQRTTRPSTYTTTCGRYSRTLWWVVGFL